MKGPFLNFETFGSIGAIIVSVAALYIAWDQAVVMRQEQHAGAWPYANIETNFQGDDDYDFIEIRLANPGVGPAIVREAYLLSGEDRVTNLYDLTQQTFPDDLLQTIEFGGAESAMGVLGVGEERQVLRLNWPRDEEEGGQAYSNYLTQAISGAAPIIGLEVCYCSVYGRCWRGRTDIQAVGRDHERVASCEPSPDFISTIFDRPEDATVGQATPPAAASTDTTPTQGAKQ